MEFGESLTALSRRPKRLNEEMLALDEETVLLEELDGFIAALLASPELFTGSDWLPVAWHEDSPEQQPILETLDQPNRVLAMVHYDNVAPTLLERPGQYGSLFSVNAPMRHPLGALDRGRRKGRRVMTWQPGNHSLDVDIDTASTMSGMLMLADMAQGKTEVKTRDALHGGTRQGRRVSHRTH